MLENHCGSVWRDHMERRRETEAVWKDRKWEVVIICTTAVAEPGSSSRWGWRKMNMSHARVLKWLHDNAAVIWRTSVFAEHECGWVFIGMLVISLLAKRFNSEKPKLWFFFCFGIVRTGMLRILYSEFVFKVIHGCLTKFIFPQINVLQSKRRSEILKSVSS